MFCQWNGGEWDAAAEDSRGSETVPVTSFDGAIGVLLYGMLALFSSWYRAELSWYVRAEWARSGRVANDLMAAPN